MTSNKDALEALGGLLKAAKTNDDNKFHHFGVYDSWAKTICTALASQNPAGTGNKDALEAFEWLLEYHLKPQPYRVKYNDKFCVKRNIVRAALSQPTPWRIDDSGNPVPFHTYNPETHILVAREDLAFYANEDNYQNDEGLWDFATSPIDRDRGRKAAALIAQKTEE